MASYRLSIIHHSLRVYGVGWFDGTLVFGSHSGRETPVKRTHVYIITATR